MAHDLTTRTGHPSGAHPRSGQDLAQALGWFSIGLGMIEALAPHATAKMLGVRGHETMIRAFGLREIAAGVGILTSADPKPWIEGRIAGDVLDMAALTASLPDNPRQGNVLMAFAAVIGATAMDVYCLRELAAGREDARRLEEAYGRRSGMPRPAAQMRGAARDFETPRDMRNEDMRPGSYRLHA